MNSNGTYSTENWGIYNSEGDKTGTVGKPMTFRQILAYFAVNHSYGKNLISEVADDMNAFWNELMPQIMNTTTQTQEIEKAAGKKVTPNVVAKPPKQEKIGNTTWHGDWEK